MPLLLLLQGRNQNEAIVLDWAKTCCSEGGILERNFSVLGPEENSGPEIILKDSMRDYKLHASGRRNCLGLLAELDHGRICSRDSITRSGSAFLWSGASVCSSRPACFAWQLGQFGQSGPAAAGQDSINRMIKDIDVDICIL